MNPNYADEDEDGGDYAENSHVWNYNKLWVWSLTDYERVVYLDSDMLILGDINHMFDFDVWTEPGTEANDTHRNFAAASDTIPPDKFNSGVMVLRPSNETFHDMRDAALSGRLTSYNNGDQGFLNAYFDDWHSMPPASRLRTIYNLPYVMAQYTPLWNLYRKDMLVLHFYGKQKPWDIIANVANAEKKIMIPFGAMPVLYLWGALEIIVDKPWKKLEDEARYICMDLFDIESDGKAVLEYLNSDFLSGKRQMRPRIRADYAKEEL
eukprot:CAMPEP_0183322362 /NCGR_PEP_ID=MMETSP0160_2-20130417/71433_1 /TAXON_ID=2839 ORGANISM="Odontella Sinensis, Strain Grunow 1884" /NCGR_SAMPLE_ID=MMETSP0160_2 /ASSEMBLY_ACC=CAM_ASM_000250 /LENGTH=264 /DNA_ID=CAMNT_0025489511 /DNA_START=41 /DNA_END=835 /DNA_ORIENTATION=-